jgi:hypothetical protein
MSFGFGSIKIRKQGNAHSLRGLTGVFSTRINFIVVMTSGHHIQQYNPPENIQYLQEFRLIYMDLDNARHYLSTIPDTTFSIPSSSSNQERCKRKPGKVSTSDGFFGAD